MTLVWRKEFDSTVAVLIIVPMDEFFNPGPGIIKGSKTAIWIAWAVFTGAENGLRIRIIIAYPGATPGRRNA